MTLLENPDLIRSEMDRRLRVIRNSNPVKQKKDTLNREAIRVSKTIKKLLDGYQEDLIHLDELRSRMPALRKREKTLNDDLNYLENDLANQHLLLKLTDNIKGFLSKLHRAAGGMSVVEKQKVLRLVVKEILIDDKSIRVKHSIPLPHSSMPTSASEEPKASSYLLRKRSHFTVVE